MAKKQKQTVQKPAEKEKEQKIVKPKKYKKTADASFRINKSKYERIFLISAKRQQNYWQFQVEGTKAKIYKVTAGLSVKCSCMDFIMKKKPCKHIYFIVTQVAQNDQILDYFKDSTTISKNAYNVLDKQLEKRLKSRLEAMSGSKDKKDIDLKDDTDCVICFSQMNKDNEELEGCNTCKKYFHKECINHWKQRNSTCPLCRGQLVGSGNNPMDKLKNIQV